MDLVCLNGWELKSSKACQIKVAATTMYPTQKWVGYDQNKG